MIVLPSGLTDEDHRGSRHGGAPVEAAFAPMSVTLHLADDVDISRGDMICRARTTSRPSARISTR